jgi:hypothetical protein
MVSSFNVKKNDREFLKTVNNEGYASKLNTTIICGGSKLLAYFEKHYNPKSLISYANRRWSIENFYFKTGFQFSHISEPNYFYFLPEDLSKLTYNYSKENKINIKNDNKFN